MIVLYNSVSGEIVQNIDLMTTKNKSSIAHVINKLFSETDDDDETSNNIIENAIPYCDYLNENDAFNFTCMIPLI